MDMFDRRRSLSLALGVAALGFAFLVSHVNPQRDAAHPVPAEAAAASPGRS